MFTITRVAGSCIESMKNVATTPCVQHVKHLQNALHVRQQHASHAKIKLWRLNNARRKALCLWTIEN